jgi:hypothetical protein
MHRPADNPSSYERELCPDRRGSKFALAASRRECRDYRQRMASKLSCTAPVACRTRAAVRVLTSTFVRRSHRVDCQVHL